MSSYQQEHFETFFMIQQHFAALSPLKRRKLEATVSDYLSFRKETDDFLAAHFSEICTEQCYQSRVSACCSKEGIIAFFADAAINALLSQPEEIEAILTLLQQENKSFKCVYLGEKGCVWRLKPIVCEMFLCGQAEKQVFATHPDAKKTWDELNQRKKKYTWPDQPVLFDMLERYFLDAGYSSPLMYMHTSPGLLRVKKLARKNQPRMNTD